VVVEMTTGAATETCKDLGYLLLLERCMVAVYGTFVCTRRDGSMYMTELD
jgi:hypothetical protein